MSDIELINAVRYLIRKYIRSGYQHTRGDHPAILPRELQANGRYLMITVIRKTNTNVYPTLRTRLNDRLVCWAIFKQNFETARGVSVIGKLKLLWTFPKSAWLAHTLLRDCWDWLLHYGSRDLLSMPILMPFYMPTATKDDGLVWMGWGLSFLILTL